MIMNDLPQSIPLPVVLMLALLSILSIALPICAYRISRRHFFADWRSIFPGVADFILIEAGVCNFFLLLLVLIPGMSDFLESHPPIFAVLSALVIALFAEGGRYVLLDRTLRNRSSLGNAMMFASGLATTRVILLIAVNSFQSLLIAMTINDAGISALYEAAGESAADFLESIAPFYTTPVGAYAVMAVDIPLSFLFHFACSILLYAVLKKKVPQTYLFFVMGIRFFYELPNYLYSYQTVFSNLYAAALVSATVTAGTLFFTYRIVTTYLTEDLALLKNQRKTKQSFPKFDSTGKKK